MTRRVIVHTICKNEVEMMKYWLRHYSSFAERIVVLDENSTDGTRELVQSCPIAELRDWPFEGLDDEKFLDAINSPLSPCNAWLMWADIDELLYHPDILWVLDNAREDVVLSTGYALIAPNGFPVDDGRQLYEQVLFGVRQPNYDKYICWRYGLPLIHTIGRHTQDGFPRTLGRKGTVPRLKLYHCHHVGGVDFTAAKNKRNYDRAVNKRFAWNYTKEHDRPEQVGTVAWVRDAIENNKLCKVWP